MSDNSILSCIRSMFSPCVRLLANAHGQLLSSSIMERIAVVGQVERSSWKHSLQFNQFLPGDAVKGGEGVAQGHASVDRQAKLDRQFDLTRPTFSPKITFEHA